MILSRSFLFHSLCILLSLLPTTALAAPATYDLISPIGGMTTGVDLATYLQKIIVVTIGIAGVLAVVMLVICGIKVMMSGSSSGKSEAKECIWNAVFGLLIAIGAWALLYTINPDLLKNDATLADVPVPAASAGSPSGGTVAGVTFSWAAGPECPRARGTISSIASSGSCPSGGTGVCCSFIEVPMSPLLPTSPVTPPIVLPTAPVPLSFSLSSSLYSIRENGVNLTITVVRRGPTTGTDAVDYKTVDGSAIAGSDYTAKSGTLVFTPGTMALTFTIPIINNTIVEPKENFTIVLSNPSLGAIITTTSAVGTITDDDATSVRTSDTRAPIVTIITPAPIFASPSASISVSFSIAEDTALQDVIISAKNSFDVTVIFSTLCDSSASPVCTPLGYTDTTVVDFGSLITGDTYTINITACDKSGNCGTADIAGTYSAPCPAGDLRRCKSDYLLLQSCIGKAISGSCVRADLSRDGTIDNADLRLMSKAGDFDINIDGIVDTVTLATNSNDTCYFHTAQDPLFPCALRVFGNITFSTLDRTILDEIYTSSWTSPTNLSLALLDANLCAKFTCTTPGSGLGGTDQLSIYGESMLTTLKGHDFNNDGNVDTDLTGADMLFFQSCITDPTGLGCTKADINLDGFVTNSDLNLIDNAGWVWGFEDTPLTLANLERIFFSGDAQPEAGIVNVCKGAVTILLCGVADLNKDGSVTAADATFLSGANIYDINGDGLVVYTTPTIPTPTSGLVVVATPSTKFVMSDTVATTNNLIVRAAAGDTSTFLGTIPTGTTGRVLGGPTFVDGNWWWKIAYTSSFTGWSIEPFLKKVVSVVVTSGSSGPVSTKFLPDERVGSTANLNVRATVGLAGTFVGMIPLNTTRGNIIGSPLFIDGYWWWQVRWDSEISGWSVENFMKEFTPPPAPKITSPLGGSYVTSSTVTVEGTMPPVEAKGTVKVLRGSIWFGDAVILSTGAWKTTNTLPDGIYTIAAAATDQSINVGPTSTPVTFTVDTTPPLAPVVTAPTGVLTVTSFTLSGTASEKGTIYLYSGSGGFLGTTLTSGATNAWSFSRSVAGDGTYSFSVREHDLAGNVGPAASYSVTVSLPPPPPPSIPPPVIISPTSGAVFTAPNVTISGTGNTPGAQICYNGSLLGTSCAIWITPGLTWSHTITDARPGVSTLYVVECTPVCGPVSPTVTITII